MRTYYPFETLARAGEAQKIRQSRATKLRWLSKTGMMRQFVINLGGRRSTTRRQRGGGGESHRPIHWRPNPEVIFFQPLGEQTYCGVDDTGTCLPKKS